MAHPIMFDEDDPLLHRLREVCLAFPGVEERVSHGRPNWRARVQFAVYGGGEKVGSGHTQHPHAVMFKAEPADLPALDNDDRFFVPMYYGPWGWRAIDLDDSGLDWTEVGELIDASYRQCCTATQLRQLDATLR